ncbi:M14 family zinc carboxypeptidase [Marinobacterium sp. YM272]|uniref:M14 family zinc carboxypeptidase n=1 Tax=Marinobacterium sp. YM272 TaxID=3421654 RepID=UPI003D7F68CD
MDTLTNQQSLPEPEQLLRQQYYRDRLPEMRLLEKLLHKGGDRLRVQVLTEVFDGELALPVYALELGSTAKEAPVLILCGGVHGIERIGTQLLLAQLATLVSRLHWDEGLTHALTQMRLVMLPLVNPVGMARGLRSNGRGVDLMRNAPIDAIAPRPWLVAGHRLGRWLPWYRGRKGDPMEAEAAALCALVRQHTLHSPFTLALDCHSGFGMRDRVWFPYASGSGMMEHTPELHAMLRLFEKAHPHHTYLFEPQFHHYSTHGDLWDYLYSEHLGRSEHAFLPLTLEMGSWLWVKKNLRQLTSYTGLFNPMVPHRQRRTLRRHYLLLEFMINAVRSWQNWLPDEQARERHQRHAERRWLKGEPQE